MIEILDTGASAVVGLRLSGKLHDEDYKLFMRPMENILADTGKVRLLIQFEDFHGWDLHAAWDDLWFSLKHYSDFQRVAMVGDRQWEKWMATFCKPFTAATVKYFDKSEIAAARTWLQEESITMDSTMSKKAEELARLNAAKIIRTKLLAALDDLEEHCDDVTVRVMSSEITETIKRRLEELVAAEKEAKPGY